MHGWLYDLGVLLAAAMTLVCLARRLPLQNVLLASCIIGGIAWSMAALKTCLPAVHVQPKPSWIFPVLSIVLIINSRTVARSILHGSRRSRFYGFGVIGVALILATTLQLILEWEFTSRPIDWRNAAFSALTALLSLLFCTPTLINKKPDASSSRHSITPSFHLPGPVTESGERCGRAASK